MSTMRQKDSFGYISKPCKIEFSCGDIKPIADFENVVQETESKCNKDGYLYPPQIHMVSISTNGHKKIHPKTVRPALIYRVPITHIIEYNEDCSIENLRYDLAGFMIHLLAFLHGQQAQFRNWGVTGRLPIKLRTSFEIHPDWLQAYVTTAEEMWKNLKEDKKQKHLTNILYCRNRLHSYEWYWEEFAFGYMVIDSIWNFTHASKDRTCHKKRIKKLCNELELEYNFEIGEKIVKQRNELFHESLWAGDTPGHNTKSYELILPMRSLIDQLIIKLLKIRCDLPSWTIRDSYILEPPQK